MFKYSLKIKTIKAWNKRNICLRKELLLFPTWVILAFYSYLITVGDIGQRMSRVVGIGEMHMHSRNDSI